MVAVTSAVLTLPATAAWQLRRACRGRDAAAGYCRPVTGKTAMTCPPCRCPQGTGVTWTTPAAAALPPGLRKHSPARSDQTATGWARAVRPAAGGRCGAAALPMAMTTAMATAMARPQTPDSTIPATARPRPGCGSSRIRASAIRAKITLRIPVSSVKLSSPRTSAARASLVAGPAGARPR
jgi:hypothetical protein